MWVKNAKPKLNSEALRIIIHRQCQSFTILKQKHLIQTDVVIYINIEVKELQAATQVPFVGGV